MASGGKNILTASSLEELRGKGAAEVSVAIGVFDGVHAGHQALIKELAEVSAATNSLPAALTFYPHPKSALRAEAPPKLLCSPEKKTQLLASFGAKAVVSIPFTKELSALSPEDFAAKFLMPPGISLKGVCVGREWRFGAGAKGGAEILSKLAAEHNFILRTVNEIKIGGETVSSTAIRRAVAGGDLDKAARMLGRPYSLSGAVEHGRHIAGSILKHPTANLRTEFGVIPPNGVYAGIARLRSGEFPAAAAVGVSPHVFRAERPRSRQSGDPHHRLQRRFVRRGA